jgi:hypothetical protein
LLPMDAENPMDFDNPVEVEVPVVLKLEELEVRGYTVDLANPVEDSVYWNDPEEVEDPIKRDAGLDPAEEDLGNLDAELRQ